MAILMHIIKYLARPDRSMNPRMIQGICGALLWMGLGLTAPVSTLSANENIEYQVKTAFIYNFIAYTRWPEENKVDTLKLCVYGENGLSEEINKLAGRSVNEQKIDVQHITDIKNLEECQAVFITSANFAKWPAILNDLKGKPILTLADSKDAASQGVTINMDLVKEKIVFEVNLGAAHTSGLNLSSKLLKLAKQVYQ